MKDCTCPLPDIGKMNKVLHLIDSSGMYGAEQVVITLLDELKGSPFPGVLGCIRDMPSHVPLIATEAQKRGVATHFFTMKRGFNPAGIRQIMKFIETNNIRIIHTHGYKPNIFLGFTHRRDHKILSTVHGWSKQTAGVKAKVYEFLDSVALKRFDRVVAVSKAVVDDLLKCGLNSEQISLIYNGIILHDETGDPTYASVRHDFNIPESSFVMGAVGRLMPVKGHLFLIKAMAEITREIKDCVLLIAGEGPLHDALSDAIVKLGLSAHIRLVGYQNPISRFLSAIDLFVMPSLTEGLPIALLEAMSCRKPVLASNAGGIPEAVTDGKEGLLVPPADPAALACGIKKLYSDHRLRKDMANCGRKRVEDSFSSASMARQYLSIYSSLAT